MKKFMFSMEKLLTYKNQSLENQLAILGDLNNQLSQTTQQIKVLLSEKDKYCEEFDRRVKQRAVPALFQIYQNYLNEIKEQVRIKEETRLGISKKIEQQIEVIKTLKQEAKSLETLKEAKLKEHKTEAGKLSELQLEEFILSARSISREFQ